jgi:transcriptional regulator with XRE-family HTH domain
MIGTTPQNYQRYEAGRIPEAGMLATIAATANVTVDWLLGRTQHSERAPTVPSNDPALMYGDLPKEYTVRWVPQWNRRVQEMSSETLVDLIEEAIGGLKRDPPGNDRAHRCHYIMDLLNELANRRKPK